MNFSCSLKPVFVLITVTFGIDLNRSKKKSTTGLCLTFFLCVFWLVCFNIPLNSYYVVRGMEVLSNIPSGKSFVYNINYGVGWISWAIFNIFIHNLILVSSNGKWETLWEKLQLLQEYISDESRVYRQLRHHTIQGLMIFIMVNKAQTYQDLL